MLKYEESMSEMASKHFISIIVLLQQYIFQNTQIFSELVMYFPDISEYSNKWQIFTATEKQAL